MKASPSFKIFAGLIIALAVLSGISVFLPQGDFLPQRELPAPKPVLALVSMLAVFVLYGGLGFVGFALSKKLGFTKIWDRKVTNRQRFVIPALIGIAAGIFLIIADTIFSRFHALGPIPHPPFPTSLVASAVAGIGEEVIFRLFFISFGVWLVSRVILKNRYQNLVFWIVAVLSALVFAGGHIPASVIVLGLDSFREIPAIVYGEIFLLNGVVAILAAYYFRKYGFLAAVGIHFWTDVVWHVIWGAVG
jgi:hypothetical protein